MRQRIRPSVRFYLEAMRYGGLSVFVIGAFLYGLWTFRRRKAKNWIKHEVPPDGNIFLSLGFPPEEAAQLLAETERESEEREAARKSREDPEQSPKS